jgi:hypothetical protein
MQSVPSTLAARLDALKDQGVIAGWQDAGGPNAGLSKAPLPALIFPANGNGALTFWGPATLRAAIIALETFGPLAGTSQAVER